MAVLRRCLAVGFVVLCGALGVMAAGAQPDEPASSLPDSPRATLLAFRADAHRGRWPEAARFLTLDETGTPGAADLARRLNGVIESLFTFDPDSLSAAPEGHLDDGLPPDIEEIARVDPFRANEPMRLQRVVVDGRPTWRFTAATVASVDRWYEALRSHWVREWLVSRQWTGLLREGPFDLFLWQWLALPALLVVAWGAGQLTHLIGKPVMTLLTRRTSSRWDDRVVDSLGPPFVLAVAVLVFATLCLLIDINREAYRLVGTITRPLMAFAFVWAVWRLAAVTLAWLMSRSWVLANASARNLLDVGTNISRGLILGFGTLAVLASAGLPVGTVLAGLGIGGLALAFGAQKTLENLFGSIALALDQPIRVGDFVKVHDFVGTVEDIGIRSTRIRTLDRTVVAIPNGKLADEQLESFELRDRMRLSTTLSLSYRTTRRQMEAVIAGVEGVLRDHPRIWPDAIVVRFARLGESSLDVEVMAWFAVPKWTDFQLCRQQVLLGFMEVVERAGAHFAFPTRTVHVASDSAPGTPGSMTPSNNSGLDLR